MELIFLKPIPKRAVWGKNKLGKYFGYKDFPEDTGQCWCASCRDEDSNIILNGKYESYTLNRLWKEKPDIFGNPSGEFPWIVGLVAPSENLSIQVHPDDSYTKKNNLKDGGKNEGWYFIDVYGEKSIVFGHNALTQAEFENKIEKAEWDNLLLYKEIRKGDFVYIPAKTIHALCKDTMVYEIQQNSNLTYRLYDYERKDANGNERDLHMQEALDNLDIPFYDKQPEEKKLCEGDNEIRQIVSNNSFELTTFRINKSVEFIFNKEFAILSILEGEGVINGQDVKLGDHIIVPNKTEKLIISGKLFLIMCNR